MGTPVSTAMSMFYLSDCRKALSNGGLTIEAQRTLVDAVEGLRDRLKELEHEMTEGRPELFEAMADMIAKRAKLYLLRYALLSNQSAAERAVWDVMLQLGFRGAELRQRAIRKVLDLTPIGICEDGSHAV